MLGKKTVEQINAKISSVIGADMVIEGNVRAKEAVRVEGQVIGDVATEGALIISAGGSVKGNAKGNSVIIGGSLEGDLCSDGRTEVASTGKVIGNIRTKSLIVDENAMFQGQCIMNAEGLNNQSDTSSGDFSKMDEEENKQDNNNNDNNENDTNDNNNDDNNDNNKNNKWKKR